MDRLQHSLGSTLDTPKEKEKENKLCLFLFFFCVRNYASKYTHNRTTKNTNGPPPLQKKTLCLFVFDEKKKALLELRRMIEIYYENK